MSLFQLDHVDVRYGKVPALSGISLRIDAGERVALVGANGSGKSTLLRVLHGLLPASAGTVQRVARDRQALVFQRPYLLRTSVLNNVALGLWLRGTRWKDARPLALQALARVEMDGLAQRSARALSGGQQQRVALAQAWAMQPDVLLLDEPTANLDPHAKREVEGLMQRFAQGVRRDVTQGVTQGVKPGFSQDVTQDAEGHPLTMVFSSHNLGQVKRLASRVIYLEHGRLLADLPVDQFFNGTLPDEAHQFVKGERI